MQGIRTPTKDNDMTTEPDAMPTENYATFAAREMLLDIGHEIGSHTLAATAMICVGMSALMETMGHDEAMEVARAAINAEGAATALDA